MAEAKGGEGAAGADGSPRAGEYALMDPRFGKLGSPALDAVNDASLFSNILSFLSGPDVARVSATSMGWRHAANDAGLWKALYARAFTGVGTGAAASFPTPPNASGPPPAKTAFRERYQRHRNRTHARVAERERRRRKHAVLLGQSRCLKCQGVLQALLAVGTPMALILTFTIFLSKRIEGSVDWTYVTVFIPLFVMMGISVVSVAGMCVARAWRDDNESRCGKVWAKFSDIPSRILLGGMLRGERRAFFHHGVVAALLITQVVFVPLRLDGLITWSWAIVFSPFFAALAVYGCTPCAKTAFSDEKAVFAGLCGMLSCFLLPLIILAALAADGVDIPMEFVLMPFWILGGLIFCFGTGSALAVCKRDRDDRKAVCAAYFAAMMFFGPWVLFEVFLTLKSTGSSDMSWESVFTPLIVWLAAAAGGGVVLAMGLWLQVVIRGARQLRTEAANLTAAQQV